MPRSSILSWSMRPSLHHSVLQLLVSDDLHFDFEANDNDQRSIKAYDTSIMGKFFCNNRKCASQVWTSKKIAITIRLYPNNKYNARIYHQRCGQCKRVSKPTLDDSYAERVAYRLRVWSGVDVDVPPYSGHRDRPHHSDLCEGCRHGHCAARD